MSFISHAPHLEDVMLWRALRHLERGFYVDAGAADPQADSVTCAFYQRGWHGLNVAPSRAPHARLLVERPADITVRGLAGAREAEVLLYETDAASTLDAATARQWSAAGQQVVQRQLEQRTLASLCAAHAPEQIHFMRIDATAVAAGALAGLDLALRRPWLLLVSKTGAAGELAALRAARYEPVWDDGVSLYHLAAEHPELRPAFSCPPAPFDQFVLREDHPYAWPLTDWRARVARLNDALASAETSAQAARDWADAHVQGNERQLAELERQLAELERQLAERASQIARLEQRIDDEQANAARIEQAARASAAHYEGTISGIYHSLSWRLTRPLRWFNFHQKALRASLRAVPGRLRARAGRVRRAVAGALKGAVRGLIGAIMARPRVSFFVLSQIGRHPRLTNWLRVVVQRSAPAPAPAPSSVGAINPANVDHLPLAARQVLADLRRTIQSPPPQ
jgi:hypothetical protein